MRISIVEKNEVKFYGIENHASESSDFTSFWKNYYKYVAADYNAPVGYISAPDEHGDFTYYTCIGHVPKNSDRFKEVILPSGNYAIIELIGSVEKTIPKALEFAKENFVIKNSPSLEVYSVGDRLNKKYRMELWIPISEVLPNFKKNTSKIGTLKRKVSDSIEDTIEFSKTDNGKKFLKVGGAILTVGAAALLLAKQLGHDANNEEVSDSQSDENISISEVTDNDGSNSEVTDNDDSNSVVTHDYPDVRKSPIVHTVHRGETTFIRGGTDEEKQRFREENNLDF
ncbi:GyrI-like domain-containing protein [Streptococcus salivarius]|uniref:GyrI-like domain-containing protein n=1 Tax=Streptococcus salivarius TaxID=1304 RepID=UPI00232BD0BE|nr:GyrI-like domain-containing protein [Streptococcus salivarius]MDB8610333.1 GyrI-like domain-containing protein [Streptococcus salivarius]